MLLFVYAKPPACLKNRFAIVMPLDSLSECVFV